MDGTLIQYKNTFQSSWRALLSSYGFEKIVEQNELTYYRQKDKDCIWAREEASLLKGKSVENAYRTLFPIPYSPGAELFLFKSEGKLKRGILSTGLGLVADKIASDFNLEFVECNRLYRDNGVFTGNLDYSVPLWEKARILKKITKKYGISLEETCYVGDNDNDPLEIVGFPIAFNPKTRETAMKAMCIISDFKQLEKIILENA